MRYLGFLPAATQQRRLALRRCLRQRRREARHKLAQPGRAGKKCKKSSERRSCDTALAEDLNRAGQKSKTTTEPLQNWRSLTHTRTSNPKTSTPTAPKCSNVPASQASKPY